MASLFLRRSLTNSLMEKDAHIIDLPRFFDERGNLSVLEEMNQVPFKIKRVFWIYDVPGGEERGGHAYIKSKELIIALSGSFDVTVNDGNNTMKYSLNRSYYGLFVPEMTWRQMDNFSTNSIALVLSSTEYDANDYIRDFDEFLEKKGLL